MSAEDLLECLLFASPFLFLAAALYGYAIWKAHQGRTLLTEARRLSSHGRQAEGHALLCQALWQANEEPALEREILAELTRSCQALGLEWSAEHYETLIAQFEVLATKGSHAALGEMKKVQALKERLGQKIPRPPLQ